jgi:hypothetical protein
VFEVGWKDAGKMKLAVLSTIFLSGCSYLDFNLACSGVNLISEVANGTPIERQVPITFSLHAKKENKIEFYKEPRYKVTVNNYYFDAGETIFLNKRVSAVKKFGESSVWFDFNTETQVLLYGTKSFVQYGNLRYQTVDNFSGKCS